MKAPVIAAAHNMPQQVRFNTELQLINISAQKLTFFGNHRKWPAHVDVFCSGQVLSWDKLSLGKF
jgi:hypothetical protein